MDKVQMFLYSMLFLTGIANYFGEDLSAIYENYRANNNNKSVYVKGLQEGKNIGREAVLIHLYQSNQIDSIDIDFSRLMYLEDSLRSMQNGEN